MDTMAQLLCNDFENVIHECVTMEQFMAGDSKYSQIGLAVNASVNSLLQTPALKKWSSLDFTVRSAGFITFTEVFCLTIYQKLFLK